VKDFWINVAAGIFLAVVGRFLFSVFMPFYRAWIYKSPPLEGRWEYYDAFDTTGGQVGTAVVKQRGENLHFDATRTKSRSGKTYSRNFTYQGRVRASQIQLSFEETTSNGFICGNIGLKVSGDRKTLTGYTVYLDHDAGKMVAHPIMFKRL
jgi:hypothetical protein